MMGQSRRVVFVVGWLVTIGAVAADDPARFKLSDCGRIDADRRALQFEAGERLIDDRGDDDKQYSVEVKLNSGQTIPIGNVRRTNWRGQLDAFDGVDATSVQCGYLQGATDLLLIAATQGNWPTGSGMYVGRVYHIVRIDKAGARILLSRQCGVGGRLNHIRNSGVAGYHFAFDRGRNVLTETYTNHAWPVYVEQRPLARQRELDEDGKPTGRFEGEIKLRITHEMPYHDGVLRQGPVTMFYTVGQGDSFRNVARHFLGPYALPDVVRLANTDHVTGKPPRMRAGDELRIPVPAEWLRSRYFGQMGNR